MLLGGTLVGGGFANMRGLCTFVDFGGSLVDGRRLIVAPSGRAMRSFCACTRFPSVLGGELNILISDRAATFELRQPAGKLVGSRSGAIAG
jgi:hypothetical protein